MRKAKFKTAGVTKAEREGVAYSLETVIERKQRDEGKLFVGRGFPDDRCPEGYKPRVTIYEDYEGRQPLCLVARDRRTRQKGGRLAVLTPEFETLGLIDEPLPSALFTAFWGMEVPKGVSLVGKASKVAWVTVILLSPLYLAWNIALALSDTAGSFAWPVPERVVWKPSGSSRMGMAALKYSGIRSRYIYRPSRIDARLAYAQSVTHIH